MKRALASVLRLTTLVAVLALLISRGSEAQLAHQCVTFETDDIICPSCCSNPSAKITGNIVSQTSPTGIQSILNTSYSCGTTPATCNGSSCSGDYPQAVSDSGCCIADGSKCANNEPCCDICRSSGSCGLCSDTGEACGTDRDCCFVNSGDVCISGVCTNGGGGGGGGSCGCGTELCPPCSANLLYGPKSGALIKASEITGGKLMNVNNLQCCGTSPILIDVGGQGFALTNAGGGVTFDIAGDGHPIQMAWTAAGANNAFLCLPDSNGACNSGKQLFGNYTSQPPSSSPNGFAALAVYDDPKNGGNGDGMIDAGDAIFSSLRLWIDTNHDGISQTNELYTLPSLGVNSISLTYKLDARTDQFGNYFRFRTQVNPGGPTNTGRMAYDVFFVANVSGQTLYAGTCPAPAIAGKEDREFPAKK